MSLQISATLDRLDTALTCLESERAAGSVAPLPDQTTVDHESKNRETLAETEAMVKALRQDSMALMNQFQAQRKTTTQVAERLDALIAQVRTVLGE